jgi:hypothetical protein
MGLLLARCLCSCGGKCPRRAQGSFREHVGVSAVWVGQLEVGKQGACVHGLERIDEAVGTRNCGEED